MRLTQIKLAGFKSFVDPVMIKIPGQLVGVVGPNGCGKSNIIDAVRWVLGESRASELRGESMQDVIFNGSNTRKPVSRASVELYFDNSLGRALGQWSEYSEIAVKRVLTREGVSEYLINNQKVRKKDITDLFLGTGLGPRAYAIIGQGMIARIIEARPEDLRSYIEEAAGVTRYKERRKETESRLKETNENLQRLNDITVELNENIQKLSVQAEDAKQFLQAQAELVKQQRILLLLKRNDAAHLREQLMQEVSQAENDLTGQHTNIQEIETRLEQRREQHFVATDSVQLAQTALYEANANVVRLESEIRHRQESLAQLAARQQQLIVEQQHWQNQCASNQQEVEKWQQLREIAAARLDGVDEKLAAARDLIPQLEEEMHSSEQAHRTTANRNSQLQQQLQIEKNNQQHSKRNIEQLQQRHSKLSQQENPDDDGQLELLEERQLLQNEIREDLLSLEMEIEEQNLQLAANKQEEKILHEQWQSTREQLSEKSAKLRALSQLQQENQTQNIEEWLKNSQIDTSSPLWQEIVVNKPWDKAVEAVLSYRLQAYCDRQAQLDHLSPQLPEQSLAIIQGSAASYVDLASLPSDSLLNQISSSKAELMPALASWLGAYRVVQDLSEALQRRSELQAGERFITINAEVLTSFSLEILVNSPLQQGLLMRQQEIEQLHCEQEILLAEVEVAEDKLNAIHLTISEGESSSQINQQKQLQRQKELNAITMETNALIQKLEFAKKSQQQQRQQLEEISADLELESENAAQAEMKGEELDAELNELAEVLSEQQQKLSQVLRQVREHQGQIHQLEKNQQEQAFSLRECESKLQTLQNSLAQAEMQLSRLANEEKQSQIAAEHKPEEHLSSELEICLQSRDLCEQKLSEIRNHLETLTSELRALEGTRMGNERALEPLRQRISDLQLKKQAAQLSFEQYDEALSGVSPEEIEQLSLLLPQAKASILNSEINRLEKAISALGAVNLKAIEELGLAEERYGYLNNQIADLSEAMQTLEAAIRRIDRETRERLKETFDSVNGHFSRLFPQLFAGGRAELIMSGEEILDAGIQVLAQPPGKKNSSIQLLSGGEKALTAIALVFAMFQLNPAPFCLLDEVDAPLDDSNTERFCQMVQMMTKETQFLYISHNKIAMEMAEQLVGVTMQESGISRIVDVDIADALGMIA